MLLPRILLTNFSEEEKGIIQPILDHHGKMFESKPSRIPIQSEFIYLLIIKHLYSDFRFQVPCISLNDQFTNPFLNKTENEVNQKIFPWTIESLTFLCAKILGELDGGYTQKVREYIQTQLQR